METLLSNSIQNEHDLSQILTKDFFYLFFNISRTTNFSSHFSHLTDFLLTISNYKTTYPNISSYYLNLYIRLIAFVRDPYFGLGEKSYSYIMLLALDKFFPQHTFPIIESFLFIHSDICHSKSILPYGSWCDIKYLSIFLNSSPHVKLNRKKQIINHIVKISNQQLQNDLYLSYSIHPNTAIYNISNVSKWIPREKNKNLKWLFYKFATQWNSTHQYNTPLYLKYYRSIISSINNLRNYNILSINNHHLISDPQLSDPQLSEQYHEQYQIPVQNIPHHKQKYMSAHTQTYPSDLVKKMIHAIDKNNSSLIKSIDTDWNALIQSYSFSFPSIPIIDSSFSHKIDYSSIAISCFLSFFNTFGKYILIASDNPTLIDLNLCDSLSQMIPIILTKINSFHNFTYNIDKTLSFINDSILTTNPNNISEFNIIIFINDYKHIPYDLPFPNHKSPNIVLWNLSGDIFDHCVLDNINYDFKFLNSNNISHFFLEHINSSFNESNFDEYFNFLFNFRYNLLSYLC